MEGFDISITTDGELIVDPSTHDIQKKSEDDLRIQLAYDRIKSISKNWFVDEVGADLEELIGRPCNDSYADLGKQKIINVLTIDELWDEDDIHIRSEIVNNICIHYYIYLKLYQSETEDIYSYRIDAELDLVKGVHIHYGWEPKL